MNIIRNIAARFALAVACCGGFSLTAAAQITPVTTGNPLTNAGSCIDASATTAQYSYTGPSTLLFWEAIGDLAIVSGGSSSTVTVKSIDATTGVAPGYGRAILRAVFSGCSADSYPIGKIFSGSASGGIQGPGCIQAGVANLYFVNPIVSTTAQINALAGIDTYTWSVSPAGAASINYSISGEQNAVEVTPAAGTTSFTLAVVIGSCNSTPITKTVNSVPSVTFSGVPSCQRANDLTPFTITSNIPSGLTYDWTVPGWSATYGPNSITVTPNRNAGSIFVKAKNGTCEGLIQEIRIDRSLDSLDNAITVSGNPSCYGPTSTYTLTVTSATGAVPGSSTYTWTLPANWTSSTGTLVSGSTYTTTVPSINVSPTANGANGRFSVFANPCSSGRGTVSLQGVKVLGAQTCVAANYTITRVPLGGAGANKFFYLGGATGDCLPNGGGSAGSGITYAWTAPKVGGGTQTYTDNGDGSANFTTAVPANAHITVLITDTNNCLSVFVDQTTVARTALGSEPGASNGQKLTIYPNPSGEVLNVDLTLSKGTEGAVRLLLVDALGRVVQENSTQSKHNQLNTSRLPAGTYLLRALLPDGKSLGQTVQVQH